MPQLNENFLKLEKNYLFINIAKKINAFKQANPDADIIRMGIGDVTLPIAPIVIEAMKKGCDEMGVKETFKGYEDSGAGYDFLREAVSGYYKSFGADVAADEIRISSSLFLAEMLKDKKEAKLVLEKARQRYLKAPHHSAVDNRDYAELIKTLKSYQ